MTDEDLTASTSADAALFSDVAGLIDGARRRTAASVNSELVMLYWSVGKRVREEVLGGERAAYGQQVAKRLAERLTERYGRGWSKSSIERIVQFASEYPELEIAASVVRQSTWTHITVLLNVSDQRKRDFYGTFAVHERWSVSCWSWALASRSWSGRNA